jgi:hypothetical protein
VSFHDKSTVTLRRIDTGLSDREVALHPEEEVSDIRSGKVVAIDRLFCGDLFSLFEYNKPWVSKK